MLAMGDRTEVRFRARPHTWSFDLVVARLEEAAYTLRLQPAHDARFLAKLKVAWPDVPPEFWASYGRSAGRLRLLPTGDQLTRLDEVLDWLAALNRFVLERGDSLRLPGDIGRIVWARAGDPPWSWARIQQSRAGCYHLGGNSTPSLRKVWKAGIRAILGHLVRNDVPPAAPLR
jgi:hypothetical protein